MRKAALIAGLLFWVAISITAFAQEKKDLIQLPILLDCGPVEKIAEMLVEYEEVPIASASVVWRLPSGEFIKGPMTIFAHPTDFTISIVIQPTENFACLAFPGNDFGPYTKGERT